MIKVYIDLTKCLYLFGSCNASKTRNSQVWRTVGNALHKSNYIWSRAIIYLAPPGGCNKIQGVCPELLVGRHCSRLVHDCISQTDQFLEFKVFHCNFVTTGGKLLISCFYMYLLIASIEDCSIRLKWKQLDSHRVHEISNCDLY